MAKGVCIVSSTFPPDIGGPATFTYNFCKWVHKSGENLRVVTYASIKKIDDETLSVSRVYVNEFMISRIIRMVWRILRAGRGSKYYFATGAFIETYFASTISKKKTVVKIPGDIVWERARNNGLTDLDIEEFQDSKKPIKYSIFRFLFLQSVKSATSVIVPSIYLFNLVKKWGVADDRIHIVHNSIADEYFISPELNSHEYDVLTVARLVPWKGVSEIIEVCAYLNLRLCIVGDGPERRNLQKIAEELSADVDFLGQIDSTKMPGIYQKSKIFVLNSYYEGLPHTLVEARASGVFSIARSGTGSTEVITDGEDGYLIGGENQFSLREALSKSLADPRFRENAITKAQLDCRKRFDQETSFKQIREIIQ